MLAVKARWEKRGPQAPQVLKALPVLLASQGRLEPLARLVPEAPRVSQVRLILRGKLA